MEDHRGRRVQVGRLHRPDQAEADEALSEELGRAADAYAGDVSTAHQRPSAPESPSKKSKPTVVNLDAPTGAAAKTLPPLLMDVPHSVQPNPSPHPSPYDASSFASYSSAQQSPRVARPPTPLVSSPIEPSRAAPRPVVVSRESIPRELLNKSVDMYTPFATKGQQDPHRVYAFHQAVEKAKWESIPADMVPYCLHHNCRFSLLVNTLFPFPIYLKHTVNGKPCFNEVPQKFQPQLVQHVLEREGTGLADWYVNNPHFKSTRRLDRLSGDAFSDSVKLVPSTEVASLRGRRPANQTPPPPTIQATATAVSSSSSFVSPPKPSRLASSSLFNTPTNDASAGAPSSPPPSTTIARSLSFDLSPYKRVAPVLQQGSDNVVAVVSRRVGSHQQPQPERKQLSQEADSSRTPARVAALAEDVPIELSSEERPPTPTPSVQRHSRILQARDKAAHGYLDKEKLVGTPAFQLLIDDLSDEQFAEFVASLDLPIVLQGKLAAAFESLSGAIRLALTARQNLAKYSSVQALKEGCALSLSGATLLGPHSSNCPSRSWNEIEVTAKAGAYRYCQACRYFQHIPFLYQANYVIAQFRTELLWFLGWYLELRELADQLELAEERAAGLGEGYDVPAQSSAEHRRLSAMKEHFRHVFEAQLNDSLELEGGGVATAALVNPDLTVQLPYQEQLREFPAEPLKNYKRTIETLLLPVELHLCAGIHSSYCHSPTNFADTSTEFVSLRLRDNANWSPNYFVKVAEVMSGTFFLAHRPHFQEMRAKLTLLYRHDECTQFKSGSDSIAYHLKTFIHFYRYVSSRRNNNLLQMALRIHRLFDSGD